MSKDSDTAQPAVDDREATEDQQHADERRERRALVEHGRAERERADRHQQCDEQKVGWPAVARMRK